MNFVNTQEVKDAVESKKVCSTKMLGCPVGRGHLQQPSIPESGNTYFEDRGGEHETVLKRGRL